MDLGVEGGGGEGEVSLRAPPGDFLFFFIVS